MSTAQRTRESVEAVIKAYDVRGIVGDGIDHDFVQDIGAVFGRMMREEGASHIAVGFDMRPSSPELSRAFAEGAAQQGMNVYYCGLTSTDELYYASGTLDCPGAMFTASHNPAAYNGIKLCRSGARPVGQESGLADIIDGLVDGIPEYDGPTGTVENKDVLEGYGEYLRGLVDLSSIRPLRVAVDAANGMAGHTVPAVLKNLPLEIEPLYFELDGTFPNHEANPLDPRNLVDLQQFVLDTKSDIGLAFDGDADRCFVVDELGQPVGASAICALVAERYLKQQPGSTIIHNIITSKTVPEIVEENGGRAVRTRVGHSFIKAKMAEEHAVFGGEHSAHYYFTEFFNADSGLLAAMHVLATLGAQDEPLSRLMAQYSRYQSSGEINSLLPGKKEQSERTQAVLDAFADRAENIDNSDGATVDLKGTSAWFNLRPSNTEPWLRLNVEAPTRDEVDRLSTEILDIIRA